VIFPMFRDSSLISTSVRMAYPRPSSEESRPKRGGQRIGLRKFAAIGPRKSKTAVNHLGRKSLHLNRGGNRRGVSIILLKTGKTED